MIKFQVKNRWSGDAQFTAQIDCGKDDGTSIKLGLAVKWAKENGANLDGASLYGANLYGAKRAGYVLKQVPIKVHGAPYTVMIFDAHMEIGCEVHALFDWAEFDSRRIDAMDGVKSAQFWKAWKAPLLGMAKAAGRSFAKPKEK